MSCLCVGLSGAPVLLMAALGIPKHESDREGETGLPQIQRARWSFPLPSKSHPIQETMLARDMVVIFSLIFCHIWEKLSLHSHNQKDRGEATFLKTYFGMVLVTSTGWFCCRMCPGHMEALLTVLFVEHATLTDVAVWSEIHRTACAQGRAGVGCVHIYRIG